MKRDTAQPLESRETLEEKMGEALDELAKLQCQHILNIDCVNKEARNRLTVSQVISVMFNKVDRLLLYLSNYISDMYLNS